MREERTYEIGNNLWERKNELPLILIKFIITYFKKKMYR